MYIFVVQIKCLITVLLKYIDLFGFWFCLFVRLHLCVGGVCMGWFVFNLYGCICWILELRIHCLFVVDCVYSHSSGIKLNK